MTPERTKELLPVMQAYAEGKKIEYRSRRVKEPWQESRDPAFHDDYEYRIAPEHKKIPLTMEDIPPGSVISIHNEDRYLITSWKDDGFTASNNIKYYFNRLLDSDTKILRPGGTWEPCWKYEKE